MTRGIDIISEVRGTEMSNLLLWLFIYFVLLFLYLIDSFFFIILLLIGLEIKYTVLFIAFVIFSYIFLMAVLWFVYILQCFPFLIFLITEQGRKYI